MPTEVVRLLAPEILLVVTAAIIFLGGVFSLTRWIWSWIALAGVVAAAAALWAAPADVTASGPLQFDALAWYVRWLSLVVGGAFVLLAFRPLVAPGTPEYVGSLLLAIAGLMLVGTAGDVVFLFLALEMISIPTYVLLYLGRRDAASQESTVKYFYLSILASAVVLYGLSFLYGASGSTDLRVIHDRLAAGPNSFVAIAKVALVLLFAGLSFRIAAVPFHFYAPDVYQGTTQVNAGFLSVVPKIAGFVALIRLVATAMPGLETSAWHIALVIAVLTMTFGNVVALWQNNLRRLLAYSSIAHAGYMLIGLAVYLASAGASDTKWDGVGALLFYLLAYVLATTGTFAAFNCLGRGGQQIDDIEELAGLPWTGGSVRPLLAWTIAVFMFSLSGIPPLAGFWGKLGLFFGAVGAGKPGSAVYPWFISLAVIGVINSAIAATYYLRIVGVMFFRLPLSTPETKHHASGTFLAAILCGLAVLVVGLHPGPWVAKSNHASPRAAIHQRQPDLQAVSGSSLISRLDSR